MQEAADSPEGYDFQSEEGRRFEELSWILYEAEVEFGDRYGAEQEQVDPTESAESVE
ncbi:MAG: hypothetical protein LBJ08_08950 [Bifidobacteriaceae bacterium]|jgi:hypothetical protein|nr:hypothetical protein [Bifidobacteriaceae bacterium]